MNITSHQLDSFLLISREGSFTKAAEMLTISPAALVQQVNRLEKELGFALFVRSNAGIRLTEPGAIFLKHVASMKSGFEDCVSSCRAKATQGAEIRIGFDTHKKQWQLYYDVLSSFSKDYPDLHIQYISVDSSLVLDDYPKDLWDFSALAVDASAATELPYITAVRNRLTVLMKADHPLAVKEIITPQDLSGQTIAVFCRERRPSVIAWCAQNPDCTLISMNSRHEFVIDHCLHGGLFLFPAYVAPEMTPLISRPTDIPLVILHGLVYHPSPANNLLADYLRRHLSVKDLQ